MTELTNWYVVRTQNNRERSVLEKLKLELNRSNLDNILKKDLIPTEKVFSVKNGKRVAKEKILYPGYLFIETSHVGEINNILKGVKGSSGFVKSKNGDIKPLHQWEVSKMLSYEETKEIEQVGSIFSVGEDIKIIDGPFTTFKGSISHVDEQKNKLKVEVLIFSRVTTVELDYGQVEKSL